MSRFATLKIKAFEIGSISCFGHITSGCGTDSTLPLGFPFYLVASSFGLLLGNVAHPELCP